MSQNIVLFSALVFLGLMIMLIGVRLNRSARKLFETIGALLSLIGIFGVLYLKVTLNLFIALVLLVLGFFFIIDPLRLSVSFKSKIVRLVGFVFLFVSLVFSLDYIAGFPVWLWLIPLVVYLMPFVIPPLKKHSLWISFLSWIIIFGFVGMISYVLYTKINPTVANPTVVNMFPRLHFPKNSFEDIMDIQKNSDTAPNSVVMPDAEQSEPQNLNLPTTPPEPAVNPMTSQLELNQEKDVDKLSKALQDLAKKVQTLEDENKELRKSLAKYE